MKRVLVWGDKHHGHLLGLTPPDYWKKSSRFYEFQRELWLWVAERLAEHGPFDIEIDMGDVVDGSGVKNAAEQLEPDMSIQVDMAEATRQIVKADKTYVVQGTQTHIATRDGANMERLYAQRIGAEYHAWFCPLEINGVKFNLKHHMSQSQVPGRNMNGMRNERLHNAVNNEQENCDVFIRAHVHHHTYYGQPGFLGMTTPCLQGGGSMYGARFSSQLHLGFVVFEIEETGRYTWKSVIADAPRTEWRSVVCS